MPSVCLGKVGKPRDRKREGVQENSREVALLCGSQERTLGGTPSFRQTRSRWHVLWKGKNGSLPWFSLGRRRLLGRPLVLVPFWTVALGTSLAVCLSLRCLFKLLGQELFVDPIQGVNNVLCPEPIGHCLKAHLRLKHVPHSIKYGAMMLGVHRVDLQ